MAVSASKTPQFEGPDGVFREDFIFSTDISTRFFTGIMSTDTVDMQVSVRGAAFSSDPDLINFEGETFIIPNPSAFPDGLQLFPGENLIQVKSVLSNGEETAAASSQAKLSLEADVKAAVIAPSGIFVERGDRTVTVTVEGLNDSNVSGYHFYASTAPGGGTVGYRRINTQLVISSETVEVPNPLGEITIDSRIATNPDGSPAADPLFFRVIGKQEDRQQNELQEDFDQAIDIAETIRQIKTTVAIEWIQTVQQFSFTHDRRSTFTSAENPAIPNAEFNAILETDPLYYVVTAVYVIDNEEYESVFSPEILASPLIVTPAIAGLPAITRQQIVRETVLSIYRSRPEIDVKPGSVLRDTFIDPFSSEAERLRFIAGFLQAGQSFATLLVIDDPGATGESIAVRESPYKLAVKQAFFLRNDFSVQNLIDNMFDHLASRRGTTRKTGKRSRGQVTFFMTSRPNQSMLFPIGTIVQGGGIRFRTTSAAELTPTGFGGTYNPATGRYSVRVFIQAEVSGIQGNLAPNQIRTVVAGPTGALVTNEGYTFGGRDDETNQALAVRADGILSSVDSGTYRGYVKNAAGVSGVLQVNVIDAGNDLMMRDIDPDTGRHTGGKVDIWIRGENLATVTDGFAFSFDVVQQGQFEPVGAIQNLRFRAVNSDISDANPLFEMLDFPEYGYEFINESTGHAFDLTDVVIIPPDGIQLSSDYNDPVDAPLTDIFRGSYRFRTSNKHIFTRQPARDIVSLQGEPDKSGVISPDYYKLFVGSLPLDMGRSNEAGDYVQVIQPLGSDPITVPSGDPIQVTGESHVMLGGIEYLNNLGINPLTIQVFNAERSIEYYGPFHPGVDSDYTLVDEVGETPMGIVLTADSRILEGGTVLVDYYHDENFVVEYRNNALVGVVQGDINKDRHVTADVLTKEAIPAGVDITATIVLYKGQTTTQQADSDVRTALGRLFGSFVLGEPVRQSDILKTIEKVRGVSYTVVPLTRMAKTDGSIVVREAVVTDRVADYFSITAWSSDTIDVFLVLDPVESGTAHGGGDINEPRGVFQDEQAMTLFDEPPDVNGIPIKNMVNSAFIIGNPGLLIPGYSDDLTLKQQFPFATDAEIDVKRQELTQRRILLALPAGQAPRDADYFVTYVISGDTGVKNIEVGLIEFLELGDLNFTWDEDS